MVRRNNKRSERLRKIRCESADSGVDTSLNNTVFQRTQSYTEINGLEEEQLDFEPELGDDEYIDNASKHSPFSQSTVKIINSDKEVDDENRTIVSTISIQSNGHRRDMLPVPRIDAKDGRQNEYFSFARSNPSNLTTLDSSSDEESSNSDFNDIPIKSETEYDLSRSQTFDGSGDFYNTEQDNQVDEKYSEVDEQSSECNEEEKEWSISQEEEERLLDGSEDETSDEGDESRVTIDRTEVDVCRIGNFQITLPKVNNNYCGDESEEFNAKRRKSSKWRDTKRWKWDLRFEPSDPPTRLFLNDIGYIPPSSSCSSPSDSDSGSSVPQSRKLYVICNEKDKFVCEKSEEELHREMFAKSDDSNFKLPLPPAKRPPTRPKRTVCNTNESNTNLQIQVVNKRVEFGRGEILASTSDLMSCESGTDVDKDDTISLIASTIGDNVEDVAAGFSTGEESAGTRDPAETDESPLRNVNYSKALVENWIQTVPDVDPPASVSTSQTDAEAEPSETICYDGVTLMPPLYPNGLPRIDFRTIPSIFGGLCYQKYFAMGCKKPNVCTLMHYISRDKFTNRFKNSSPDLLRKGYSLAINYSQLFKEIYPCFLLAYGALKLHTDLTKAITDLLQIVSINAMEALELVVQAFCDSGLTFLDTIERISFNVGFLQYPVLADILLDLITRKSNIAENWEVINRIARARGNISPEITRRILNRVTSVYPVDKKLCLAIYNAIIKNNMTDVGRIGDGILAPFRAMLGFRELEGAPPAQQRPPIVQLATGHNDLAAHIDMNLVKERERFEREAAGQMGPARSPPARIYEYRSGNARDCFSHDFDSDDRYFMPVARQEPTAAQRSPFKMRPLGSDRQSASGSSGSFDGFSPQSSLHFEPPSVVSEYVPQSVRRNETSPRNYSPIIDAAPEPALHKLNVNLTPAMPIFGNPRYRRDFKFDVSLHNLLPDTFEDVNINERDVGILNYAIKSKNGAEFARLLDHYKSPATIRNFITMTIAHLKSCENGLYELLVDLIQALEIERPAYAKDPHMKVTIEVVIMNILFELERRGHWEKARKLLERFCDWDSLISSQIFPKRRLTHMGRYIFLAKVFAKGKNYHFTSEILQCSSLHLLESSDNWPYACDPQADMKSRNVVLSEFFQDGYRYNIVDVSDMFRRVYKYSGIFGYDAYTHFNPMLISIMNGNQVSLLKPFYADIDIYNKVMDKNVLRAFTVLLADQLGQESLFRLYDMCCDRQIYTYYSGCETIIILRTNMLDQEVRLILSYYLEKVSTSGRLPVGDLRVVIKLFESKALYPKVLQACVRSVQEINEKVREILGSGFGICVKDTPSSKPTVVEVGLELLEDWLHRSQRRFHAFATC